MMPGGVEWSFARKLDPGSLMARQDQYFFATVRGHAIAEISALNSGSDVLLFE
jgi:hypothetical protein